MAATENQINICENWGFYIDIEYLPPKYIDNYTKMKEKYKIKNSFYTDFETIYEDLEYYNEVKYPQTIMRCNYKTNKANNINLNKMFCAIYCVVATSLLVIFVYA